MSHQVTTRRVLTTLVVVTALFSAYLIYIQSPASPFALSVEMFFVGATLLVAPFREYDNKHKAYFYPIIFRFLGFGMFAIAVWGFAMALHWL